MSLKTLELMLFPPGVATMTFKDTAFYKRNGQ